jgi:hypothetical protein
MLICIDCHRTNAPWAKRCAACGASLHESMPNTLIAGEPGDKLGGPPPNHLETPQEDALIRSLTPDTKWHALEDIDSEKILDPYTIEPITVIDPSRTAEIDWGDTRDGSIKFDSTPFPGASKDRFDEYGYDFEKANTSAWKSSAVMLAGIVGILFAGGWAINYLHATTANIENAWNTQSPKTITPLIKSTGNTPNGETGARAKQQTANPTSAMTEEILYDTGGRLHSSTPSGCEFVKFTCFRTFCFRPDFRGTRARNNRYAGCNKKRSR